MNTTVSLVLTLLLQLASGLGVLAVLRPRITRSVALPSAVLIGMFMHTLVLFLFALASVEITRSVGMITAVVAAVLPHVAWPRVTQSYGQWLRMPSWSLSLADVVTLGFASYLAYAAFWAAWYWPVTPFDAVVGIDLVAKTAVEDHTLVNRVFTDPFLSQHLSNQPFYAPFAMLLQVIYRLMGYAHGQLWVPIVAVCFMWLTWVELRRTLHHVIANVLWLLLLLTPEMLGYTYLVQTDYLNAAMFVPGVVFLWHALRDDDQGSMWVSTVFFAAACWSRTDALILVMLGLTATLPFVARASTWKRAIPTYAVQTVVMATVFAVWHVLYFNAYLPVRPSTSDQLLGFDFARAAGVASSLFTNVIADVDYWGWLFLIFPVVMIANAIRERKLEPLVPLVWIGTLIFGFIVIGTIFSAAIVEQTLRRGIFKLVPLMVIAMAGTQLLQTASRSLTNWEAGRTS